MSIKQRTEDRTQKTDFVGQTNRGQKTENRLL
jgi:hypothetical protein